MTTQTTTDWRDHDDRDDDQARLAEELSTDQDDGAW